MFKTLAEAAANCTRNITAGMDPVLTDTKRRRSISALISIDDQLHFLLQDLKNDDTSKRVSAICSVAEIGPKAAPAVPALMDAVEDIDWVVRVAAITALGEIGPGACEAVPVLIGALSREDVCVSAAIALGRIGPAASEAREPLTELKRRKLGFDCWCAEEALRLINTN